MITPADSQPVISVIAHLIQLSVAPVFLLAGIGSVLGVMASRLGRIVDRARFVEGQLTRSGEHGADWQDEMLQLEQRARSISTAIAFCTFTALLVCTVIALMFLSALFSFHTADAVAVIFILAMVCFMTGLILLLREVLLATRMLRFGPRGRGN